MATFYFRYYLLWLFNSLINLTLRQALFVPKSS